MRKFGRVPKMGNSGEYRKWGIRVSTEKGRIRASTGKLRSRHVLEIGGPGKYQKWGIRVSTGKVKSERVSEKVKFG